VSGRMYPSPAFWGMRRCWGSRQATAATMSFWVAAHTRSTGIIRTIGATHPHTSLLSPFYYMLSTFGGRPEWTTLGEHPKWNNPSGHMELQGHDELRVGKADNVEHDHSS